MLTQNSSHHSDSQSNRMVWLHGRRGGSLTKYKGVTCGVAPEQTSLGAVVMLSAVTAFGGLIGFAQDASAGSCVQSGTDFTCSGAADPDTDTTQSFTLATRADVTTSAGFGIDLESGSVFDFNTNGGFSFTDQNEAFILGSDYGFNVVNYGGGDIVVDSNGVIAGGSAGVDTTALRLINNSTDGSIVVNVDIVGGGYDAIIANNAGAGGIAITSTGLIQSIFNHGINISGNNGQGNVSITANVIDAVGNGINVDTGSATGDFNVDVTEITAGANGIYGFVSGNGDTNITVGSIDAGDNGIWIDVDAAPDAGVTTLNIGDITAGNEGINIDTNANTSGLEINVNDVTSGASSIRFNHRGSGDTIVRANDITANTNNGIWFNTWGDGDVIVSANNIDAGFIGVWLDTDSSTQDFILDVNDITAGDDGINAVHSGTGTVDINVTGTITAGDDGIEFYAD
ncbi:hypothetical protein, partial [Celeribacter sp.]|uniref:hypothetical protein n=1 Tax=Celeribacter sp. TaxID=1890673 RepID=UPI003A936A32